MLTMNAARYKAFPDDAKEKLLVEEDQDGDAIRAVGELGHGRKPFSYNKAIATLAITEGALLLLLMILSLLRSGQTADRQFVDSRDRLNECECQ